MNIWIIGAGEIAQEYGRVLNCLGYNYLVIGRGEESALAYKNAIGHEVITGGLDDFLSTKPSIPDKVIIATNLDKLSDNTIRLLEYGVKNIFCEKPGFLYPSEIERVYVIANYNKANVYYAYNRRFFSSVLKAEEIIKYDGGVKSFNFEFTEWGHVIEREHKPQGDLDNWMYANSTHVLDLAFFLGGFPTQISSFTDGQISWHKPSIFAGAGVTDKGALFTYSANWGAPGRWSVEVLTTKNRLYFRPMEKLQVQVLGTVAINDVELDDHLDREFKPGFYLETKAFVEGNAERLCSLEEHFKYVHTIYKKIHG